MTDEQYTKLDKFRAELDRRGFARIDNRDYKIVTLGDNDQPAYERVILGDRETIVGTRGQTFSSIDQAINTAVWSEKERMM